MLKLSGWSRLTWGRDRSVRPPGRGNETRGPFGADPGTVRRDCSRGPVNHRSSRPPSPGPSLWANRELVEIAGGHIPPPRPASTPWRDLVCRGGRRCVTPRQTCPRPDGFGRNLRSKTRWFTGFCNSHQVSHFATFFIDARAEISVAESRFSLVAKEAVPRAPFPGRWGVLLVCMVLGASGAGVLFVSRGGGPCGRSPRLAEGRGAGGPRRPSVC